MSKIRVFETFAGIGAQHKALDILSTHSNIEFEVVATSEWDIWANISYNAIHHNNSNIAINKTDKEINDFLLKYIHSNDSKSPMQESNLLRLGRNIRELLYSSYKNSNNLGSITNVKGKNLINSLKEDKVDLLTYSFPCQDLSMAGTGKGMGKGSGTRSGLLWEIERILLELKDIKKLPNYLMLENVNSMLFKKNIDDYLEWVEFLYSIGYETKTYVLNSAENGLPQTRKRVYAISKLKKNPQKPKKDNILSEIKDIKDLSKEFNIDKSINDVIKNNYENEIYFQEAFDAIPNRTKSRKRMYINNPKIFFDKEKKQFYVEYNNKINGHIRTITTKQDRHPNAAVINIKDTKLHDFLKKNNLEKIKAKYRFLTPRETFLLMGFEEADFNKILDLKGKINLNLKNKNYSIRKEVLYRQAGNSIAVNVLVNLFNYLLKEWKE